jgi:hypothetical protein
VLSREEKEARRGNYSVEVLGPFGDMALLWLTRAMRGAFINILADRLLIKNSMQGLSELSTQDRELSIGYLYLDAMAKTETIIETFLALCYVLAFETNTTAQSLARYPSMVWQILPKLDQRILGGEQKKTVAKILSLPEVDSITHLSTEERELILKLTDLSIQKFAEDYIAARDFYECHLIPYNKMRHGMSVIMGMKSNLDRANFAVDVLKEEKMRKPPNIVEINGVFPLGNMLAIVPADERTLKLYEAMARETDMYARYIVGSMFSRICNSGERYLPCIMHNEQTWLLSYVPKSPMSADEKKMFDQICERIQPDFVIPNVKAHIEFRFGPRSDPQIQARLEKYYSAAVHYSGEGTEASYEHGYTTQ